MIRIFKVILILLCVEVSLHILEIIIDLYQYFGWMLG